MLSWIVAWNYTNNFHSQPMQCARLCSKSGKKRCTSVSKAKFNVYRFFFLHSRMSLRYGPAGVPFWKYLEKSWFYMKYKRTHTQTTPNYTFSGFQSTVCNVSENKKWLTWGRLLITKRFFVTSDGRVSFFYLSYTHSICENFNTKVCEDKWGIFYFLL